MELCFNVCTNTFFLSFFPTITVLYNSVQSICNEKIIFDFAIVFSVNANISTLLSSTYILAAVFSCAVPFDLLILNDFVSKIFH